MRTVKRRTLTAEQALEFERCGDPAFDMLRGLLLDGALPDVELANGLAHLAVLTRHQCHDRREEALEVALQLLRHGSEHVRSTAANSAIGVVQILEHTRPEARKRFPVGAKPSLREQVQEAIRTAVGRGLSADQLEYAERFLANRV